LGRILILKAVHSPTPDFLPHSIFYVGRLGRILILKAVHSPIPDFLPHSLDSRLAAGLKELFEAGVSE
jgi:hypothetical protein